MQSKLMYWPEVFLIYVFLKWLHFKLMVPLIYNHPITKQILLKMSIFAAIQIQVKSSLSRLHRYEFILLFEKE